MKLQTLAEAFGVVDVFCKKEHLNKKVCYKIELICEELVVNILKYTKVESYNLLLHVEENKIFIEIDYEDISFDSTKFNIEKRDVEEMAFGGLGLFLVNTIAKNVDYSYKNGVNQIEIEL